MRVFGIDINNYILGYSERVFDVFKFDKHLSDKIKSRVEVESKLLRVDAVSSEQWKHVHCIQGLIVATYLRLRYGSPDTHIILGYVDGKIAHVEWVVPSKKIRSRYPHVTDRTYFITACVTSPQFRGKRIYPNQLRKVVDSQIENEVYWGSTEQSNIASLKGIKRAGGRKTGEYVHRKWFWGIFSKIKYFPGRDC